MSKLLPPTLESLQQRYSDAVTLYRLTKYGSHNDAMMLAHDQLNQFLRDNSVVEKPLEVGTSNLHTKQTT